MNSKVALITGGSQRIGAAIVRALHARNMTVAIHYYKSAEHAENLAAELNEIRANSAWNFGNKNLADLEVCSTLPHEVVTKLGRLDLLVNNASLFEKSAGINSSLEHTNVLSKVNLFAPYQLTLAAAPFLQQVSGSIVNISDIYAQTPKRSFTLYCATKAALESLTRSFALEMAPAVRVNAVAPGAILWPSGENAAKENILKNTPMKRLGTVEEIATAVVFLACDATFTTGQVMTVDGGRTIVDV